MDAKIKHLEFIQDTIKRMAGNSFLLRGWSITLIVAIFTLASQKLESPIYLWIALFTIVIFWCLDAYYLCQERRFRCLYEEVRKKDPDNIDFSMTLPKNHCDKCKWLSAVKSPIFVIFYGLTSLILVVILFTFYFTINITFKAP